MPDPFMQALVGAFNRVLDRELAEEAQVREEILRRGTYWAGAEIWKLRQQVAALRRRLRDLDPEAPR